MYDKEIAESETIKSLIKYSSKDIEITIFNNGPNLLSDTSTTLTNMRNRFNNVKVIECVCNKPLSILYNDFLSSNNSSTRFVILDDDSVVTDHFFSAIIDCFDADLIIPMIRSIFDNKIYYPIVNKTVLDKNTDISGFKVLSISSGLILTKRLVDKFNSCSLSVFDENYALYGVDTSFFKRLIYLRKKGVIIKISCLGEILHSLSRVNVPDSKFRIMERMYDLAISTRRYPSILNILFYSKALFLNLSNRSFLQALVVGFIHGKHPRSKKWKNKNI
ncbi:glycosyltransferase [Pectobacterium aroidearum]|uniref:glycosyltransferase family 2 protein n=1 Tax=Pectobacterium aroidearum TaxID=1201031 RepID=UPI0021156103|nr:glycosyltransferase [Pectobacterium aroidearum]UUE43773.1 glycosyltransferase [Pectobacterium aroidearum]UUE60607.1 glycosyltransferase [Pectobacterium aroidearum]